MVEPNESGAEVENEGEVKATLSELFGACVQFINHSIDHKRPKGSPRKNGNKILEEIRDNFAKVLGEQRELTRKHTEIIEKHELLKKELDEERQKQRAKEDADRLQKEVEEKRKVEEEQRRAKEEAEKQKLEQEKKKKKSAPKPLSVFMPLKFSAASPNSTRGFFAGIGGKKSLSGRLFHLLGADYMHDDYHSLFPAKPAETTKPEAPKSDASKPETSKPEAHKADAAKPAATTKHDEKVTKEHTVQKPVEKEHKTAA